MFDHLAQDLRFGFRNLRKNPGLMVSALVSLGFGIGATTAIYSVIQAVIFDPFPYRDTKTLASPKVAGSASKRDWRFNYSPDEYLEIAEGNHIFEATIASTISDVSWTGQGDPERLRGNFVTTNTFPFLGVAPLVGRTIIEEDGKPGAEPVAVLSYKFWQRRFGGDKAVLGRTLLLNDRMRTVVGVMPQRFLWRGADVWLPIVYYRGEVVEGIRGVHVLGRLKPGVTEAQAEGDLRPIIEELVRRNPKGFPKDWRVGLISFDEAFASSLNETLWILLAAVVLLLLTACANVSNLLLARATAREREMAIRLALGASRGRIVRQLLTESVILALAGGVLGTLLAVGGVRAIRAILPPGTFPDEARIALNAPVLVFGLAVSVITAVIFGFAPALESVRRNLSDPMKASGKGMAGPGRSWVRNLLVGCEVALSLMLLVGATLMMRTEITVRSLDLGFQSARLLIARIPLAPQRYPSTERRTAFLEEALRRIGSVPGVRAAALNTGLHPFGSRSMPIEVTGQNTTDSQPVQIHEVSEKYAEALGSPLVRGRYFSEDDIRSGRHVAVVNEAFVRRYLSGDWTAGRTLLIPGLRDGPFGLKDVSFEMIGTTRNVWNDELTKEVMPEVYLPFTLRGLAQSLVVRTDMPPLSLASAIRKEIYGIDPAQPITGMESMTQVMDQSTFARTRFNLFLFSIFAGLGLLLASMGLYGVMSYAVSRQTQEIGVRMALGATQGNIAGMVLWNGSRVLVLGIVAGLAGSLLTTRWLATQLVRISPFDPLSFGIVAVVLLLIGLQACFWPARRATRVDPMVALRYE
jgi:putative ABC transport system permease protein